MIGYSKKAVAEENMYDVGICLSGRSAFHIHTIFLHLLVRAHRLHFTLRS